MYKLQFFYIYIHKIRRSDKPLRRDRNLPLLLLLWFKFFCCLTFFVHPYMCITCLFCGPGVDCDLFLIQLCVWSDNVNLAIELRFCEDKAPLLRSHPKSHSVWTPNFASASCLNRVVYCRVKNGKVKKCLLATWSDSTAWHVYALTKLCASLLIDGRRRQTVKLTVDVACVVAGDIRRD